jgi:quercetin dioxygenase-like cupin family protein
MNLFGKCIRVVAVILCSGLVVSHVARGQGGTGVSHSEAKERERIVLSKELPTLDGKHLKATVVEVNYGAGEASSPHSHPCAVLGYIVEGILRTQVKGEPEITYKAGESFYEAPNGVHLISANASSTRPAKLVAYLICDHDTPLSVNVPEPIHEKGSAR